MPQPPQTLTPGQRVTVTQQVQHKGWTTSVTGTVQAVEQRKTGSWFAHAKDDRLWLDRLVLRKDDGEVVVCNLDAYSRIEAVPDHVGAEPDADLHTPTAVPGVSEKRVAGATVSGAGSHPTGATVHGLAGGALEEGGNDGPR